MIVISKKKANRVGRVGKYHTNIEPNLEKIKQDRLNGLTIEQIAKRYKIAISTLMKYQTMHTELKEVLKEATVDLMDEIEKNTFQKAKGGYEKKKTKTYFDAMGNVTSKIEETEIAEPDTTLSIFLLKTQRPHKFAETQKISIENYTPVKTFEDLLKESVSEDDLDV